MTTTGIWYAATDGYLHHTKTGEIGPQWDLGDLRLTREQRIALGDPGDYIPTEYNTGLYYGWRPADMTPVYPVGSNVHITLTPGTYENRIFWGEVRIQNNGSGPVVMRNCVLAGQDPETIGSATKTDNRDNQSKTYQYAVDSQALRAFDTNHQQWVMEDCLVDPGVWWNADWSPPGGPRIGNIAYKLRSCLGIRGGSGTILRCRLRNMQDLITVNQPALNGSDDPSFFHILSSLLDEPLYYTGADHWQAEGTHSDSIQFHRGKNIHIIGNRIRAGHNAGVMLLQEVSSGPNDLIENVLITKNVFEGVSGSSGYGINHGEKYANPYTSTEIYDNDFIARADEKYIIARQKYLGSYGTNRVATWDTPGVSLTHTGTVTIANGGP